MVDVSNSEELRVWLEALPEKARVSIAARSALRALPAAMRERDHKSESLMGRASF